MRVIVAECTVEYEGRLQAHLPRAKRLIMIKSDGCVAIHADGGAYKPMNWMNAPNTLIETEETIRVLRDSAESLEITIHDRIDDRSFDFGREPALEKDGVEAHLQELLADAPATLGDEMTLLKREYPTPIGPVDLLCQTPAGEFVAVEIKRHGGIDGIEQLTRYLEFLNKNADLSPLSGMFVAQTIKPQAKVLASERGIATLEVDYDELRGIERPQQKLF